MSLTSSGCGRSTVTYFGGMNPELWAIDVSLSSTFPQQQGSMTISHDCTEGGTFSSFLPVTLKIVFTRQTDSATRVIDVGMPIPLNTASGGHWQHTDPGFGVLTTPGGFLVDSTGDGIPDAGVVPGSSNFFPGSRELPCDCPPPPPGPQPADAHPDGVNPGASRSPRDASRRRR